MAKAKSPVCAKCPTIACTPPIKTDEVFSLDKAQNFCPMKLMPEVIEKAISEYDKPEVKEKLETSSRVSSTDPGA